MKILFIGGTGRLSKDVAEYALKMGNDVYLLTRGSKERNLFVLDGYNMLQGDIRDRSCKALLDNMHFDVIIDFLTFNTEQLKMTLDIIQGHYNQYIFISSATVYKKNNEYDIISEKETPIGNDKYRYSFNKYKCELFVRDYFSNRKEFFTIIRPYVTYGNTRVPYPLVPRRTLYEWSFVDRILQGKPIPVFDKGEIITTLMHTKDFARVVVCCFGNEKVYNEAFHIANDSTTTWGEVLDILGEIVKCEVVRADISKEDICKYLSEYDGVLKGDKGHNMQFNVEKMKEICPESDCTISLQNGLRDMVDFYMAHKELQKIDYKWNGKVDRLLVANGYKLKRKYHFSCIRERIDYIVGFYSYLRNVIRVKK